MRYFFVVLILIFSVNLYALKESRTYEYSFERIYSTMIRFLVVEENAEITKKDIEGAYIKFKNSKEEISGVIEIIKTGDKKTELKINFEGAHYKLVLFFKKFNKKLKSEQKIFNKKE